MKKNRQEAIIELIQQYPIETQEELLSRLNQIGFKTTQATISRDIRELALIKKPDADGKQIYCLIDQEDETSRKYQRILAEAIISMELAENMLVVKTVSGMAMASAAALDSLNIIGMVGTIAHERILFYISIWCVINTLIQCHSDSLTESAFYLNSCKIWIDWCSTIYDRNII